LYGKFDLLDGRHPWREVAPEGYVDYRARYRDGGHVVYFNFPLAMEMGLIPLSHSAKMNTDLEKKILETFSLQIINEYDLAHPKRLAGFEVRPQPFMATRYLQMQHQDKCGRTSGDGRSIWNGCIKSGKMRFDISSRGTGSTILSPGVQEANRPLATGDSRFGYASGTADLDEMLGSAVMSEIFFRQGLPTERCLTVIDYGDGSSIGVRTAPNLVRPAHLFRYLKMGKHVELKKSLEYFLRRQEENGTWKLPADSPARFHRALESIGRAYGKLAAVLEEEYIFNWLSWDGDNVLADGSILDYGSIRQFAAKHDKYRYEDVDRYSTSLGEQRRWARLMVQAFAQAIDFVITGTKKNLRTFQRATCLNDFDQEFQAERDRRMLWRIGFESDQVEKLMSRHRQKILAFRKAMEYFEDLKVSKGPEKVSDGINHRPVFLIRSLLRELPRFYADAQKLNCLTQKLDTATTWMTTEKFCTIMAASYAEERDLLISPARAAHCQEFQECYLQLLHAAGGKADETLNAIAERAAIINNPHRMTGNGMVWIIDEILAVKDRMDWDELQDAIEAFIHSQVLIPGKWKPIPEEDLKSPKLKGRLLRKIKQDLELYKETV
jgi:uncharacterized protein YdiU (UPF0061 family)